MDDTHLTNMQEVLEDEAIDEFSEFFKGNKTPKILITTSQKPTKVSSAVDSYPPLCGN